MKKINRMAHKILSLSLSVSLVAVSPVRAAETGEQIIVEQAAESTVSWDEAEENTVFGDEAEENTVFGDEAEENTVSADEAEENTISADTAEENTVFGDEAEENTVFGDEAEENTVSGDTAEENTVSGNMAEENTVSGDTAEENTVYGDETEEGTVSGDALEIISVNQSETDTESKSVSMSEIPEMSLGYIPFDWDKEVEMTDKYISLKEAKNRQVNDGQLRYTQYDLVRANIPANYPASVGDSTALQTYLTDKYPSSRNQNPFGTCWSHGSVALGEFFQVNKGGKDKSIDYSELYLALGMYRTQENPTIGNDDAVGGISLKNGYTSDRDILDFGGNYLNAAEFMTKGFGYIRESDLKYINDTDSARFDSNGNINCNLNSLKSDSVSRVTDVYQVDIKSDNGFMIVKEAIMQNGIVGISYFHDNSYYNDTTNSYYNYVNDSSNHAVTIVGWDDNYPIENFAAPNRPSKEGAWLVRNSWGSSYSKFFSKYKYFWMSYEDLSLQPAAYIFDISDVSDDYDNNYYYDTQIHLTVGITPWFELSNATVANVYSVAGSGNETINEVTLQVEGNTSYTMKIYTSLSDSTDPESGDLAATVTGTLSFPGIYTIPIPEGVTVEKDSKYSVVVTTSNKSVSFEYGYDSNRYSVVCGLKAGQTFFKKEHGSEWVDWYDYRTQRVSNSSKCGNACISVHTINTDTLGSRDFRFTPPSSLVYDGNAHPATVTPVSKDVGAITVYYKDSDSSSDWTVTAPTDAGTYKVKIDVAAKGIYPAQQNIKGVSWEFTIEKAEQPTLTLSGSTVKTYGDEDFTLSVSGGAGDGAVTFGTKNSSILYVNRTTGTVTIRRAGTATITAVKAADKNHKVSNEASLRITVNKKDQEAITVNDPGDKTILSSGFYIDPTGGSGTGSYVFSSSNSNVLEVTGYSSYAYVTVKGLGTATISVYRNGDENYNVSETETVTISVTKASQSIVYLSGSSYVTMGSGNFNLRASGGSGTGSYVFSSSDTGVLSVNSDGLVTIIGTGTAVISVYKEEDSTYFRSATASKTIQVSMASQGNVTLEGNTSKRYGDPDFFVTASGGSGSGAYVFSSSNTAVLEVDSTGKVSIKAPGEASIQVYKAADASHQQSNTASLYFVVNKGLQETVTLTLIGDNAKSYGDPDFYVTASGGTGSGSLVYSSSNTGVLNIGTDGKVRILAPGSAYLYAYRAADSNYNKSNTASMYIRVSKGTQSTVTLTGETNKTYGDNDFYVTASGGSTDEPFYYYSGNTDILEVNQDGKVTIKSAGSSDIRVYKPGNTYYNQSNTASIRVTVSKGEQKTPVSINAPSIKTYGDESFSISATGGNGTGSYVFSSSNEDVIWIDSLSGRAHVNGAGTVTIKVYRTADSNYQISPVAEKTITVNKGKQSDVEISDPGSKNYGDSSFYLETTGGSGGGTVTFRSSDPDILEINDNVATIHQAGTVTIYAKRAGDSRYLDSEESERVITISKASLVIRADYASMRVGSEIPELTCWYDGLVYGDTVTEAATLSVNTDGKTVGKFPITFTDTGAIDHQSSYDIETENGVLTVNELYAQYNDIYMDYIESKNYGDDPFYLSFYGGDGNGDFVVTSKTPDILSVDDDGLATILKPGQAEISVYKESDGYYEASDTYNMYIDIYGGTLIFRADYKEVQQGDAMPEFTYTVEGLVNSDAVTEDPVLVCDALDTGCDGWYYIDISGGKVDNMDYYDNIYYDGNYLCIEYTGKTANGLYPQCSDIGMNNVDYVCYGDDPFYLSFYGGDGDGSFVAKSETQDILNIDENGLATILAPGYAEISVYKECDGYYDTSPTYWMGFWISNKDLVFRADDKTIKQGGEMPEFTYSVEGLAASDQITENPDLYCYIDDTSCAGTYTIDIYGGSVTNSEYYNIYYECGNLIITDPYGYYDDGDDTQSDTDNTSGENDGSGGNETNGNDNEWNDGSGGNETGGDDNERNNGSGDGENGNAGTGNGQGTGTGDHADGSGGSNNGATAGTTDEKESILETHFKGTAEVKGVMVSGYMKTNSENAIKKTKFKSSNKKVAKVNNKGIIKGGKISGTATITMYIKTEETIIKPTGKEKKKLSKWKEAGSIIVENTGKE